MSRTDATKYPSAEAERFQVRLPDGLRDEIRKAAADNNRSMNAEIVTRLSGQQVSRRDWFAGQALPVIGSTIQAPRGASVEDVMAELARGSYLLADALLAAREKAGGA